MLHPVLQYSLKTKLVRTARLKENPAACFKTFPDATTPGAPKIPHRMLPNLVLLYFPKSFSPLRLAQKMVLIPDYHNLCTLNPSAVSK
jgi:hypothetical protein